MKIFLVLAVLMTSVPAFAYIDPGTGGMLLQLLLGGVAGLVVIGKLYWRQFKGMLNQIFKRTTTSTEPTLETIVSAESRPESVKG